MPRRYKYPKPDWLSDQDCDQTLYLDWLDKKASNLFDRDKKRGTSKRTRAQYKQAIHKAAVESQGRDHYTGEPLDWHLIGTYDVEKSKKRGSAYKREFIKLPTIDLLDTRKPKSSPVIAGWGSSDSKRNMSYDELLAWCEQVLVHAKKRRKKRFF